MTHAIRVAVVLLDLLRTTEDGQPVRRTLAELRALRLAGEPLYPPGRRGEECLRSDLAVIARVAPLLRREQVSTDRRTPGRIRSDEVTVWIASALIV